MNCGTLKKATSKKAQFGKGEKKIKTFQDLQAVGENEQNRMQFCLNAIKEHQSDTKTREAAIAEQYFDGENVTITTVDKFITDVYGRKIPDIWSPNHKIKCHLYPFFVKQQVQTLLGNGISFNNLDTLKKLGKGFEKLTVDAATDAINEGCAFGFWNLDHLEKFKLTEFVPLYDEETGRLAAGIRFWQLAFDKPLRFTLFEIDGYTEYIKRKSEDAEVYVEKQRYINNVTTSDTGIEIAPGKTYSGLPIIPFSNEGGRSALHGNRESIDAYDLIASKLVNNIDNGEFIYWIIKNAPAMADDPEELQAFLQKLKTSGVVSVGADQEVDSHKVEIPFEASESALSFMRKQLFFDFMAFDPESVSGGADTATRIRAAYEPLTEKLDRFEWQVTEFITGILELAGIDDTPTYPRSLLVNKGEEIQNVISAAEYTSEDYTTRKLLDIIGDADKADEVINQRTAEESARFDEEGAVIG